MSITKQTKINHLAWSGEFKIIECREATTIIEDGKIISSSNHRTSYAPDKDISNAPPEVQEMAGYYWTEEIKKAWVEHLSSN